MWKYCRQFIDPATYLTERTDQHLLYRNPSHDEIFSVPSILARVFSSLVDQMLSGRVSPAIDP